MFKTMNKSLCALAVLAATSHTVLAESVDVKVIGTITPTACTPTLAGGGVIDYGVIRPASLKTDTFTELEEKQVDFSITCDAPAKVAIRAVPAKVDTVTDATAVTDGYAYFGGTLFDTPKINVAGLGLTDNGKKIGGYGVRLVPGTYTADGNEVVFLNRQTASGAWSATLYDNGSLLNANTKDFQYSWAKTGESTPVALTALNGKLGVQAYITQTSELDLTKPITLDGLTTLEMIYL